MPQIKIERIVSFTSEDPSYPANNILSKDTSKKWKCKSSGEKSASVVLQLDQPYIINSIDIGNENSAYIEVLVARSSTPEDFKVLLVMSSFMSPLEARQTQNVNKVRMFKLQDLSEPERNEKWDRVKIVCTQPFNRHVQYGLCFINLYYSDSKSSDKPMTTTIGKFTIRPESPDNISIGSLFARKKMLQENSGELKGAAAIREATNLAHTGSPATKKINLNLPKTPKPGQKIYKDDNDDDDNGKKRQERHRNELLYNKDEEDEHEKIDKLVKKRKEEKKVQEDKKLKDTPKKATENKKTPNKFSVATTSKDNNSLKRKHDNTVEIKTKKTKKLVKGKPFAKLLEDVVLVISGIQNPDRASLRSMALSMGAKYKADWDSSCTHLICAFAKTPKFNQVKGKGKIVKRTWIDECYNQRKKLPWRRFALDKTDQGPESEDEICEKDDTPIPSPVEDFKNINSDTDDDTKEQGSDTDERISKLIKKQAESKPLDDYSVDTDNELINDMSHDEKLEFKHKFKDFFENKIFYVDEQFDEEVENNIKQYIVAYNGILVENLDVFMDLIVTNSTNYKTFKDLYPNAICIAPDWIWECHNCQKLMPMKDFIYE